MNYNHMTKASPSSLCKKDLARRQTKCGHTVALGPEAHMATCETQRHKMKSRKVTVAVAVGGCCRES